MASLDYVLGHLVAGVRPRLFLRRRALQPDPGRRQQRLPVLLAREHAIKEVRPGVHRRARLPRAHAQHQELGLQDQQENSLTHRADGWREGAVQDMPALPADVLAAGTQGTDLDQRTSRAHEHGRALEAENRLWASCRRFSVS